MAASLWADRVHCKNEEVVSISFFQQSLSLSWVPLVVSEWFFSRRYYFRSLSEVYRLASKLLRYQSPLFPHPVLASKFFRFAVGS